MSLHDLWNVFRKDFKRYRSDPWAFAIWLMIPLSIGTAVTLMTGGGSAPAPRALVLIADEDDSFLSGMLVEAFNRAGELFRAEKVDRAAGSARIAQGDGSAFLVIPKGFGEAVLNEQPTRLQLVTNPEQRILPQMVAESLEILSEGVFYLHRLMGPELRAVAQGAAAGGSPSDTEVARLSVGFYQAVQRFRGYLFPPIISLETATDQATGPQVSLSLLFFPGFLMLSLLFSAQGLSDDYWHERAAGTLRRSLCTPGGLGPVMLGKLLAGLLLMAVFCAILLALGMYYHAIPWQRLPLALLWSTLAGGVFLLFLQLLQICATSQRAGGILTSSIIFPLMMIGGSLFPMETMPAWMAAAGRWTPNGWALVRLQDILLGQTQPALLSAGIGLLALMAAPALALTFWRLKKNFARS